MANRDGSATIVENLSDSTVASMVQSGLAAIVESQAGAGTASMVQSGLSAIVENQVGAATGMLTLAGSAAIVESIAARPPNMPGTVPTVVGTPAGTGGFTAD
jgi:hypothetical protein